MLPSVNEFATRKVCLVWINIKVDGFSAEHYMLARYSMLVISRVSGFNVSADWHICCHTIAEKNHVSNEICSDFFFLLPLFRLQKESQFL